MMGGLLELADHWLSARRVELEVFTDNERAIRLYERAGFEREGVLRAYAFRDGAYADVLLMSSLGENLPYVALEALACETPVAAFRVGGLIEIVGESECGVLAAPFDGVELAAGIDALLEDGSRRAICGVGGRRWVEATCNIDRSIAAHLAIYRRAIADFDRHFAKQGDRPE